MSIDTKDAEVQLQFSNMKKLLTIDDKITKAQLLAKMYEKDDEEYSVGVIYLSLRFLGASTDSSQTPLTRKTKGLASSRSAKSDSKCRGRLGLPSSTNFIVQSSGCLRRTRNNF